MSVFIFHTISQILKNKFIHFGHENVETGPNSSHTEKPKFTIFAKLRFNLGKNVSLSQFFAVKY